MEEGHQGGNYHTDGYCQAQDVLDDDTTGVCPFHQGIHEFRYHNEDYQPSAFLKFPLGLDFLTILTCKDTPYKVSTLAQSIATLASTGLACFVP